jgi:hypothetical protein
MFVPRLCDFRSSKRDNLGYFHSGFEIALMRKLSLLLL